MIAYAFVITFIAGIFLGVIIVAAALLHLTKTQRKSPSDVVSEYDFDHVTTPTM